MPAARQAEIEGGTSRPGCPRFIDGLLRPERKMPRPSAEDRNLMRKRSATIPSKASVLVGTPRRIVGDRPPRGTFVRSRRVRSHTSRSGGTASPPRGPVHEP